MSDINTNIQDSTQADMTLHIPDYTQDDERQKEINEAERSHNEEIRIANENTRIANETSRLSAESTRVTNENARISAETTRVANENTRMSNEATREQNEIARENYMANLQEELDTRFNAKVDKEQGKGLSTNDYTTTDKNKLAGIQNGATKTIVDSSLDSISENPVQNKKVYEALGGKVDKVNGKGLSTEDYTTSEKSKLSGIETGATKTVIDSSLDSISENPVQNKKIYEALETKQNNIDINNKLNADFVDDTNAVNKFVTATEKTNWNNKYDKPNTGIPKTDLSDSVQVSLDKADSAVQDVSGKEDKSNKVTLISSSSTDTEYPSAKCVYDSQANQDELIAELQDQIDDLNTEYDTATLTGESIDTTDSAQAKADMDIEGNSKQKSTTGKNLIPNNATSQTINGVTFTVNDDKTIKVNGTATGFISYVISSNLTMQLGTFTLSGCPSGGALNTYYLGLALLGSYTFYVDTGSGHTKTYTSFDYDNTHTTCRIVINEGTVCNNLIFKPMFEEGSTATDYEPYTGTIPSPNPNYEQPIYSAGDNVNLFDKDNTVNGYLKNDGTVQTASGFKVSDYIDVSGFDNITISGNYGASEVNCFYDSNKDFVTAFGMDSNQNKTMAIPSTVHYLRTTLKDSVINEYKVEQGTKASPWSPYGMGCVSEKVVNKNYMKLNNIAETTKNGVTYFCQNGVLVLNGTLTSGLLIDFEDFNLPAGDYFFSSFIENATGSYARYFYDTTDTTKNKTNGGAISIDSTHQVHFRFYANSGCVFNNAKVYGQLEEGSTATPFEEHKEQNYIIPTQQPMRSIGDVRDGFVETQSGWVERHYISEIVLDGTESWNQTMSGTKSIHYLTIANKKTGKSGLMCNYYVYPGSNYVWQTIANNQMAEESNKAIFIRNDSITSSSDFKAYLSNNNAKLDYVLAEPIDLPCTAQQIQALEQIKKAKTYQGVTHIYSEDDVPAYVKLDYKKSNKLRIEALEKAIISLGNNV